VIRNLKDFEGNIITGDSTVVEVLKALDNHPIKVLFVVDEANKLIASVTDGDIRRAILKGVSLESKVEEFAHKNPVAVVEDNAREIEKIMDEKTLSAIPLLNESGQIVKIYIKGIVEEETQETIDLPVVIMAGGQGKRLYPYTKILPKPLIPIEDTPICERIIQSFISMGCRAFHMVVNYKKNMIKSYFADAELDCNLGFVDEDVPLGTGGGLKLLEGQIDQTFILTNCDILILEDLRKIVRHHLEEKNDVTMVCSLKNFEIPYGIVNFSEGGEISSFAEKPKMSFFTNTGYYLLEPSVMNYIGDNENIGMPDIIQRMRQDGKKVGIYPIGEDAWLDMGQFDSMEGMERRLRELKM